MEWNCPAGIVTSALCAIVAPRVSVSLIRKRIDSFDCRVSSFRALNRKVCPNANPIVLAFADIGVCNRIVNGKPGVSASDLPVALSMISDEAGKNSNAFCLMINASSLVYADASDRQFFPHLKPAGSRSRQGEAAGRD